MVAGATTLPVAEVRQPMLNSDPLAELGPALRRGGTSSEPLLQRFVLGNAHRPAVLEISIGAAVAQRADSARVGVELDRSAERQSFRIASRARDGPGAQVDAEGALGEEGAVARYPRPANHVASRPDDFVDHGARDVAAVHLQHPDAQPLPRQVGLDCRQRLVLRPVRGCHLARENGAAVEVRGDVRS